MSGMPSCRAFSCFDGPMFSPASTKLVFADMLLTIPVNFKLFDDMVFLQNHCYVVEEADVAVCGTRGWICPGTEGFDDHDQKIYDRELIRLEFSLQEAKASGAGEIIAALHYPPTNDKLQPSGFTQMLEDYGVSKCIYGHLHGKHRFRCGLQGVMNGISYRLVSQDYLQGDPILLK